MKQLRSMLARWPVLQSRWVKYGAIALGLGLWMFGLADQFQSLSATMTYLAMSLAIVAIAVV